MLGYGLIVATFAGIMLAIFHKKIFKWRIFQASILKQGKWLITPQEKIFKALVVVEEGVLGIGIMPIGTGFLLHRESMRAWRMIHDLCVYVEGVEGRLLPICDRTYLPLDPWNKLAEQEKQKAKYTKKSQRVKGDKGEEVLELSELDAIAAREHDMALARLRDFSKARESAAMFKTSMIVCGIILALIVIGKMIWK